MRFILENFSGNNLVRLMRQAGYILINDYQENSELSFIKKVGLGDYPRFHAYLELDSKSKKLKINLHLDQKKLINKISRPHAAEYEGELAEKELERLIGFLQKNKVS